MKHSRPNLIVLSSGLLLALVVVATLMAQAPGGGTVQGSVFYRPPVTGTSSVNLIFLPDIDVYLRNQSSGVETPTVRTDLYGRYEFRPQPPGIYELRWRAQRGWAAGVHPSVISLGSEPAFPVPAAILPVPNTGVVFGKVSLNDGRTPWSYDELYGVNHTATAIILDATRTITLSGPVRANVEGLYAAAGLPRSEIITIRGQSQASISTVVFPASAITFGGPTTSSNVRLPNQAPEILTVLTQVAGVNVKTAPPGSTIILVARTRDLNSDPLQYDWAVLPGSGTVTPAGTGAANWQLPGIHGRYSAYLQVRDGRGGFARHRIDFVTSQTETRFTGRTLDKTTRLPVVNAEITVNGRTTKSDSNGFYSVSAPLAARYVMTITREGYADFSRASTAGLTGQTWPLVRAQVQVVNPRSTILLIDRRQELERWRMVGAQIEIPPNSLVSESGGQAPTALVAYIATLAVQDGEMPGDWGATVGGRDTNLISYGAVFVEFRDAGGRKYNLAPGRQATVRLTPPPSLQPPPVIPLWSYDEKGGSWTPSGSMQKSEGGSVAPSGRYAGTVTHFSTINADLEMTSGACLKVLIYPPIPTGAKLRVTDPTGTVFVQTFEFVMDAALNAVYRLPPGINVRLELLNSDGTPYANTVLLEETPGVPLVGNIVDTGTGIPAGQPQLPPVPYDPCKLVIMREADAPTSTMFLSYKGVGTDPQAQGYYDTVDPNGLRQTLGDWWNTNGFIMDPITEIPTNAVRTSYLNFNDLGSGRDMYFLQRPDGTVASYVTNYGQFNQDHANADLAAFRILPGATVAMEYGPVEGAGPARIVKFFVFDGNGGGAAAVRQKSANLDGFGPKFVPNLCLNCHGGNYFPVTPAAPTLTEVDMSAAFRELDYATYKFPFFALTPTPAEKAAFKDQNEIVRGLAPGDTLTNQPIKDLINGWYALPGDDQDNTWTPPGWLGAPQQGLYHDVVKQSCRTCHIALDASLAPSGIGWLTYAQFQQRRTGGLLQSFALCTPRTMPHAVITYRNFWLSGSPHRPAVLRTFSNGAGWPAIGACPP